MVGLNETKGLEETARRIEKQLLSIDFVVRSQAEQER